jgi:hypothetical protein
MVVDNMAMAGLDIAARRRAGRYSRSASRREGKLVDLTFGRR